MTTPPQAIAITLTPPPPGPVPSIFENGTVFVALFALLGVGITAWAAHMKGKQDRSHSAAEAHTARLTAARREVYLDLMSAVGNAQKFLGGLGTGQFTNGYEEGLVPLMTAVNKASVVGEMATVKLARDLVTLVNEIFFEAAARVLPIASHLKEAELHDAASSDAREEIKRVLATMRTSSETQKTDEAQWKLLLQTSQDAQETLEAARKAEQLARQKALSAKLVRHVVR